MTNKCQTMSNNVKMTNTESGFSRLVDKSLKIFMYKYINKTFSDIINMETMDVMTKFSFKIIYRIFIFQELWEKAMYKTK